MAAETIDIVVVDIKTVARGFRVTSLLDSDVYNENDEEIGTLDDLVIDQDRPENISFAILEVGGFLGLGARRVAIEFGALSLRDGSGEVKIVLPGANKESLEQLPEFGKTS
jgi:sporulation protein YlmC with PRC-barrel domain